MAYRAYKLSLNGKPAPVIDGFTGPQRFFLGWAQIWRRKYRDDELRMRLVTDSHSPSEYRCNGVVSNITESVISRNFMKSLVLNWAIGCTASRMSV